MSAKILMDSLKFYFYVSWDIFYAAPFDYDPQIFRFKVTCKKVKLTAWSIGFVFTGLLNIFFIGVLVLEIFRPSLSIAKLVMLLCYESVFMMSFMFNYVLIINAEHIVLTLNSFFDYDQFLQDEDGNEEWCIIKDDEDGDLHYTDYDEVREAIEEKTERSAGTNRGISKEPIIVSVFSPHVVSLTVVDLPGIVKVPVGDQPKDIEAQVQDLILKYIASENALILAVSPANADIATSESIKIAKQVDPEGNRTLAVVTKLDLMDKGTDATKVLNGEIINVKLGIIGAVNRSQADIDNDKSIEEAMKQESTFLNQNYPSYFGRIGSVYLATRLNELLQAHIKKSLPGLIERIIDMTSYYEKMKRYLGTEIAVGGKVSHWVMSQAVNDFVADFENKVEGRQEYSPVSSYKSQLLGAEINKIFNKFCYSLKKGHLNTVDDFFLETQIANTANVEGFTSIEGVFKNLAKGRIAILEKSSTECADEVHQVLSAAVKDSLKDRRLLRLNEEIAKVTKKLFISQLQDTKRTIKEYISIQTAMIYSNDEKFLGMLKTNEPEENKDGPSFTFGQQSKISSPKRASFPLTCVSENSGKQCAYVKGLINSYMDVMRCQISDYIPKHIFYHLYKMAMQNVRDEIKKAAEGRENYLLQENESIVRQRRECNEMLEGLLKAYEIVNNIDSSM